MGQRVALGAILLLATVLNFAGIDRNGLGNTYYAVAVQSMLRNWHNWFFASFDPAGFVAVDKPPLGFWIQTLSVRLFGFNGIALMLPQAVAGVVSVWLLYALVKLHFGWRAALVSAAVLAIAPITVVTNRSNTPESLLLVLLLGAAYATGRAMLRGSLWWLALSGVLLGLAFNVKTLEAYLVAPALGTAYLLTAPISWRIRLRHLAVAGSLLIVISLAWITAVDLVPPDSRPYVGSSYHNSELDLLWLYNGVQRLQGTPWTKAYRPGDPQGLPGPLRLVTPPLAGQSGWLLMLALPMLGLLAYHPWRARCRSLSQQQGALLLWGLWLAPMLIIFSISRFFNIYYLTLLSPAIAALVGIGVTTCWSAGTPGRWEGWLLWGGIAGTTVEQSVILLTTTPTWNLWLVPVIWLLGAIALIIWLNMRDLRATGGGTARILRWIAAVSLAVALGLAPLLWTLSSLHPDGDPGFPRAGPAQAATPTTQKPPDLTPLIAYLRKNAGATTFLVATVDAPTAIPIMLATGDPVMAMGGYTGFDPILTPATLSRRIADHAVRFFYLPASNLTVDQVEVLYPHAVPVAPEFTNALTRWVAQHCHAVPPDQWSDIDTQTTISPAQMQLFDCGA